MKPEEIKTEVLRLAAKAKGDWCPNGGWQFPFDFGHGIVAPTYSPTQVDIHPWRREVMLRSLDAIYAGKYQDLSVLDLGAGEGAMTKQMPSLFLQDMTEWHCKLPQHDK